MFARFDHALAPRRSGVRAGLASARSKGFITMTDLVVRPLVAGEEDLFLSLTEPALVGIQSIGRDYRELAELGQYRPEWTWVALRGDRVVARAAWWAGPDDDKPIALDWLDFDDGESAAAVEILATAGFDAEYCLVLPPRWRDDPATRRAGEARLEVAQRAGMRPFVERLRYTWTPADGLPDRPGRLRFEPEPDDDRDLRRAAPDRARCRWTRTSGAPWRAGRTRPRGTSWSSCTGCPRHASGCGWRTQWTVSSPAYRSRAATTTARRSAGRRGAGAARPRLRLRPARRGHPPARRRGREQITAETDTTNTPMAATFARAGYPLTQERVYLK